MIELIVISDSSDSDTDSVCHELLTGNDIYIRRNGQPGPSESRNVGIKLARGCYILFLDDDDSWHPSFIEQLSESSEFKEKKFIYYNCSVVTEKRKLKETKIINEVQLDLCQSLNLNVFIKNQIHMSCFAFPKTLVENMSFDPFMRAYEDWEFLLGVFEKKWPIHIPVLGSRVFEVKEENSDRRGSSTAANDFNAPLDYLYVYRRHPAPTDELKKIREQLIQRFQLIVHRSFL